MSTLWTNTCECGVTVNAAEPLKDGASYSCPGCGEEVSVKSTPPAFQSTRAPKDATSTKGN